MKKAKRFKKSSYKVAANPIMRIAPCLSYAVNLKKYCRGKLTDQAISRSQVGR